MPIEILEGGFREVHTATYPSPFAESIPVFDLGGLQFGGHHYPVQVETFEPGGPEIRTQRASSGVADGVYVGRDYKGASTWAFGFYTNVDTWAEALELAEEVAERWSADGVRDTPGAVVPLRYYLTGRWRRVYGRPERYAGPDGGGAFTRQGRAQMTADFVLVDHLHYDDVEEQITVGMVPSTVGGFTFPLTFPMTTARRTEMQRTGQFAVGGRAPTWPRITIQGPITDPEVSVGAWSLRLRGSLAYDQSAIIDTAPWVRSIVRNDGAGLGGMLSLDASLLDLRLAPGTHELGLSGTDLTGTARATIAWRNAYRSL